MVAPVFITLPRLAIKDVSFRHRRLAGGARGRFFELRLVL
jgi:hypothetical protein